jgi:exonuclease SbcC
MERLRSEGVETEKYEAGIGMKKTLLEAAGKELEKTRQMQGTLELAMGNARAALEEAQRTARMRSELQHAQAELGRACSDFAAFDFSEEKWKEAKEGFDSLRLQEAKCSTQLAGKRQSHKLLLELAEGLSKECGELGRKAALASQYTKSSESMVIYKNSLSSAQGELRMRLVEEINAALAEIWTSIYPYSDYSGIKLEADGKDYRVLMEKSGWREADSVASGGERACVCLALRIAFATILTPDVGWLILDEPTHNLDADAVAMLSEAISSKIPSIVEQTFVITHEASLGESAQGAVFQLEREKGKNGPTTVERLQG